MVISSYERYGHGLDAESRIDVRRIRTGTAGTGTGIGRLMMGNLPVAIAERLVDPAACVPRSEAVHMKVIRTICHCNLWRRLNAAAAWIALPAAGAAAPADCCFHARVLGLVACCRRAAG